MGCIMSVKSMVAQILERNIGQAVSGQELADGLGVSRAAVWKAVKQLQEQGYRIAAGRNRGYVLLPDTDVLSEGGIRLHLSEQYRDVPVEVLQTVDSTNSAAKAAALNGMPHGTIIAADGQTSGRGRLGKSFYSPPQTGLYMSVILKPDIPLSDSTLLTAAAACAVTDSILQLCGVQARIKWVNDIFCSDRKVCGILTEAISDFESGTAETVIVGIGLNISTEDFPDSLRDIAGSLGASVQRSRSCADIACRLLEYSQHLDSPEMMEKYRSRSMVLGRRISFEQRGRLRTGRAVGIDDCGCLVVETDEGREILRAGGISLLPE